MKRRNIINNKRGQFDLISIMITFFFVVVAGGIVWYVMHLMNVELIADEDLGPHTGHLEHVEKSFAILNWGPVALLLGMFVSLLISYYKVGSEPHWFIIHFLVLIVVVIAAAELSNYYYELTLDEDLGSTYITNMKLPTMIMFNLPMILGILGFVSIIILVSKWAVDKNQGSGGYGYTQLPGGY
jgi:glucan phosphoethanolaminetransferase (alkaline phosphatase superfamily)